MGDLVREVVTHAASWPGRVVLDHERHISGNEPAERSVRRIADADRLGSDPSIGNVISCAEAKSEEPCELERVERRPPPALRRQQQP